jgi:hypothetical protein
MLVLLIITYGLLACMDEWKFMYQRTALNVCRSENIQIQLKGSMVPYWHIISFYPTFAINGALLILIWINSTWYVSLIAFTTKFIMTIIPIPHSFFLNRMEKRLCNPKVFLVKKEFIEKNETIKEGLLTAIRNTRQRHNV